MLSSKILNLVAVGYFSAWLLYLGLALTKNKFLGRLAVWVMRASVLGHGLAFIQRFKETQLVGPGHIPLTNLFESLSFFSLSLALAYSFLELIFKENRLGVLAAPAAFLVLIYASLADPSIKPLVPALKSNWLASHVVTCFFGYAGFTLAFILGLGQFFWPEDRKTPLGGSLRAKMGSWAYQLLVFGFIMLSAGILTGSIWAERAWGSYWSWDPKETCSLVTWLLYALAIHLKVVRGWSDKKMAILIVAGFGAMVFTYLGVNKLLPGLHAYGAY